MFPLRPLVKQTIHSGQANHRHNLLSWRDADVALLALLVTFPVIGVLAVLCIGVLILQKLRLQTRLDGSCWWLINYSDITIIREQSVWALKQIKNKKRTWAYICICTWMSVFVYSQVCSVCLCLLQGFQAVSLSTTASQSCSSGSQSNFSNNSYGLKDKTGREHVFTTIGLYQVPA